VKRDGAEPEVTAAAASTAASESVADRSDGTPDFAADGSTRYVIERELARGGLGRVLIAYDRRLGRTVAIKEVLLETPDARRRFVREALLTARLEHPAIVPVHDVGRWPSGELFYCMKRVSGRALSDVVRGARELRERLTLIPNLIAVADAVAYAHAHGVLHRDLKPANILVGDYGETLVIDWGIAKAQAAPAVGGAAGDASDTAFGAVLGTPAYMPPEQARGAEVDVRADVYALGAVIYAVLAGRAPFEGSAADVLERLRAGPPPPLAERAPGAPADLVAIAERAMARDPAQRYGAADELVADLRRFQNGQLVAARSYSVWAVVRRWIARHRAVVATVVIALLALVATGAIALRNVLEARQLAELRRVEAERDRAVAVARAYQLTLSQARSALESDPTAALAWLKVDPSAPLDWRAARDVAADALSRGVARYAFATRGADVFAIDPTRPRVAIGYGDGSIDVWSLDDGARRKLPPQAAAVWTLAFDPDSGALYAGSAGEVRRWEPDLDRSTTLARGDDLGGAGVAVARGVIAYAVRRDVVAVIARGGARRELAVGAEVVRLDISKNGERVAAGDRDGVAHVWSVATGEELLRARNGAGPTEVALAPDGSAVGAMSDDGACKAWDVRSKTATAVASGGPFGMVVFSATGRWIACATRDYVVALDRASGRRVDVGKVRGATVAFSPDERWLVYNDANAVELEPLDGGLHRSLRGHSSNLTQLEVSPDGAWVVSFASEGSTRVWRMPALPRIASIGEAQWPLAISPDGTWLAAAGMMETLSRIDVASGAHRTLGRFARQPMTLAIAPDGASIATGAGDEIRLWDPSGGASRVLGRSVGQVNGLAFAPGGDALVSVSDGGSVSRWTLGAQGGDTTIAQLDGPTAVAYSPDGSRLACGLRGGAIAIVPVRGGGPPRFLRGHDGQVTHVTFSRDGLHLASSSVDGSARWWDVAAGTALVVAQHTTPVWGLALSPDDRLLASGGTDRAVTVADVDTGQRRMFRGHTDDVSGLAFARDGAWVAAGSLDGTIHFLVLDEPSAPVDPRAFERWLDAQTSLPSPAPAP
jgi:WD40 repeat protein